MRISVAVASEPKLGQRESGDKVVVRFEPDGSVPDAPPAGSSISRDLGGGARALLALVDALGHGPHSAVVARAAADYLLETPLGGGVEAIVHGLHERLRGTRGAAAMLCLIEAGSIQGCSVGNVDLRNAVGRVPIVLTAGVLGKQMRPLRIFRSTLENDRLVMFSDGIGTRFAIPPRTVPTDKACQVIFDAHRRNYDDATVIVADTEA